MFNVECTMYSCPLKVQSALNFLIILWFYFLQGMDFISLRQKNVISPMQYIIQILWAFSNHTGIDFNWFYLTEETQIILSKRKVKTYKQKLPLYQTVFGS